MNAKIKFKILGFVVRLLRLNPEVTLNESSTIKKVKEGELPKFTFTVKKIDPFFTKN